MPSRQLEGDVSRAIYHALIGKQEDNALIVNFFSEIFLRDIQLELNEIIRDINTHFYFEAVTINAKTISLLKEQGIELTQHSDGSIEMIRLIGIVHDTDRRNEIIGMFTPGLPADVIEMICSYDAKIKICRQSYNYIFEVMNSDNRLLKRQLIELAINQNQLDLLNEIFEEIKSLSGKLNLASTDLRGLNLRGLDLSFTDLSFATLTDADLAGVDLSGSDLTNANFNFACLEHTDLSNTNLTGAKLRFARLHRANLHYANLRLADLAYADLNFASLAYSVLYRCNLFRTRMLKTDLSHVDLQFTNISMSCCASAFLPGMR